MKVGIVGSGYVGATAAYALVTQGVGREVVLVDKNRDRAGAEADDIRHAVPFAHPLEVNAAGYEGLRCCEIVLLCAGVNQQPGETRLQLLQRNAEVFAEIVPRIIAQAPNAILVVATNPVDVMTHITANVAGKAGIPSSRVIGSGTTLDTARFRSLLGAFCQIDAHHVHANVLGEHGDSEVLAWSNATIAGIPLGAFARHRKIPSPETIRQRIDTQVRRAAYSIIQGKGATYYGVGAALARLVDVILHNQRSVLTICTPTDEVQGVRDVTLSLPRLLSGQGVIDTFSFPLVDDEATQLRDSARTIRDALDELNLKA